MIDQARRALDESNRRRQRGVHVERRFIAPGCAPRCLIEEPSR
jgi:hypothetical protein